ncbi:MAG: hypothetical protein MPJ25_09520, partial [Pirellulales bacterium]|nr:hypothetical protein [Pirellulales bacterium]
HLHVLTFVHLYFFFYIIGPHPKLPCVRSWARSYVKKRRAQTPIFENVANLATLPEVGCEVIALPMKITGGSGGPLRIIARPPPQISKQKH